MKRHLLRYGVLFLAACALLEAEPQPKLSFTEGASGTWNADWFGVAKRTYFWELPFTRNLLKFNGLWHDECINSDHG
jgi:hypothetical protein